MKVWVCYFDYDYEGVSDPVEVFGTEEKAQAWADANKETGTYIEFEVA